ncbi:hypothetical protein D3C73_1268020 [compost metagenome]
MIFKYLRVDDPIIFIKLVNSTVVSVPHVHRDLVVTVLKTLIVSIVIGKGRSTRYSFTLRWDIRHNCRYRSFITSPIDKLKNKAAVIIEGVAV